MSSITRRNMLKYSAITAASLAVDAQKFTSAAAAPNLSFSEKYVTCFYQFGSEALARFTENNALPNGPGYAHIFSQSSAKKDGFQNRGKHVHDCGESFKWAPAFDLWTCENWQSADDAALKKFAQEFRDRIVDANASADYFAFNEMPPEASNDERLRGQLAKLLHYLSDIGGGPKLRGVFYLTEENLDLPHWKGDPAELWQAVDDTCDLVVAEHYHTDEFVFGRTLEEFSDHLFAIAHVMDQSGDAHAKNIAHNKYCVLHSSFWGKDRTPWQGMVSTEHDLHDLEAYFHRCIAATRLNEFGKRRISFAPLAATKHAMGEMMFPVLADALAQDARKTF